MNANAIGEFATKLLSRAQYLLTLGEGINPVVFLLIDEEGKGFKALTLNDTTEAFPRIKPIIEKEWGRLKIAASAANTNVTLLAVLVLSDGYSESFEDAITRIKDGRAPFEPRDDQEQIISVAIYQEDQQWMYEHDYTVKNETYIFSPLSKTQTIDSPAARLRNLWPCND